MSNENMLVALVTGSRKGIGKYLAQEFLKAGYLVAGCSRGESEWSEAGYTHFCLDIANEKDVARMLRAIHKQFGRLDVTVNNAGIASMNHALLTPGDTLGRILDTNVKGTFFVSRESAKVMRKRSFGRIVNFTSVAVPLRLEGESAYAASKGAVEVLTRVLARELAPMGITVNAVGPPPVDTDLIRGVPKDKIEEILTRQAIHRLCTFEDIFNLVNFLIQPASGMVTGQVIYLGGV